MEYIYVDHAATTPVHPEVIQVMADTMANVIGNPSSVHSFGRKARQIVDEARTKAASSINAEFQEIIFTSGGTEADNMAILGVAYANRDKGNHIITTQIEHHAVLHACEHLEKNGFSVTYLPVDRKGQVDVNELKNALRDDTILVSIMYANNEVGTIQPIREIGELLKNHPAYFHTDAVQAYGTLPIDVKRDGIELLSVSSHKINGPKGIGFLYVKDGVKLAKTSFGGEQERKRRAGTENVPAISGFKKAIELMEQSRSEKLEKYHLLKSLFIEKLKAEGIRFSVNGSENSLPHIVNMSFPGTNVEQMLVNLDLERIAASSGSACTAGSLEPSHVLAAMFGKNSEELYNSIRFSFGMGNTEEQIEKLAKKTAAIVRRLVR